MSEMEVIRKIDALISHQIINDGKGLVEEKRKLLYYHVLSLGYTEVWELEYLYGILKTLIDRENGLTDPIRFSELLDKYSKLRRVIETFKTEAQKAEEEYDRVVSLEMGCAQLKALRSASNIINKINFLVSSLDNCDYMTNEMAYNLVVTNFESKIKLEEAFRRKDVRLAYGEMYDVVRLKLDAIIKRYLAYYKSIDNDVRYNYNTVFSLSSVRDKAEYCLKNLSPDDIEYKILTYYLKFYTMEIDSVERDEAFVKSDEKKKKVRDLLEYARRAVKEDEVASADMTLLTYEFININHDGVMPYGDILKKILEFYATYQIEYNDDSFFMHDCVVNVLPSYVSKLSRKIHGENYRLEKQKVNKKQ